MPLALALGSRPQDLAAPRVLDLSAGSEEASFKGPDWVGGAAGHARQPAGGTGGEEGCAAVGACSGRASGDPSRVVGGAMPVFGMQWLALAEGLGAPSGRGGSELGRDAGGAATCYAAGVASAHSVIMQQWADGGDRVLRAGADFVAWLREARPGVGVGDCSALDVLAFVETRWLREHQGRRDGGLPVPGTLDGLLSALGTFFRQCGRGGPYDDWRDVGNPVESVYVSGYRKGYRRVLGRRGEGSIGAVPMQLERVVALSQGLLQRALEPEVKDMDRLMFLRDRCFFVLLWATAMRAHDCGKLTVDDFRKASDLRRAYDWRQLSGVLGERSAGVRLCIWEWGDKTHQAQRAEPYFLEMLPAEEVDVCAVRALALYHAACEIAGRARSGVRIEGYVFRPLTKDRREFQEAALGTPAIGRRLEAALRDLELDGGETCHSFRRGRLQHEAAKGAGVPELLAMGHMKALSTLHRYLDPGSHLARLGERAAGTVADEGLGRG